MKDEKILSNEELIEITAGFGTAEIVPSYDFEPGIIAEYAVRPIDLKSHKKWLPVRSLYAVEPTFRSKLVKE